MQDHVVHFYHLHTLDWVDVVSALLDPAETKDGTVNFKLAKKLIDISSLQNRRDQFCESGQLVFSPMVTGRGFKLPPEVNLLGAPILNPNGKEIVKSILFSVEKSHRTTCGSVHAPST
jgi:Ni,Fe-hydrogenase I large subunit